MPGFNHKGEYKRYNDLTGKQFNCWTVIEHAGTHCDKKGNKTSLWKCVCKCGNVRIIQANPLTHNRIKSCGCANKGKPSNHRTHCMSETTIYYKYKSMKQRCYNQNSASYKYYGGKGIKICDEWLGENGFVNFYNWSVNNGYNDDLSLERIDINLDYSPNNCKWITFEEQAFNKSNSVLVNGLSLARLTRERGIVSPHIARCRYKKLGWDLESAISIPVGGKR